MCFYCGCREIPLLRDFIAEHERVTDLAASLTEAIGHGDLPTVAALMTKITDDLDRHWRGEEDGLFREMSQDREYQQYIDALAAEHRELRNLLSTADLAIPGDRQRIVTAMAALHDHIAKEEDGLFPAALTALSGEQWDRSINAWHTAHAAVAPHSGSTAPAGPHRRSTTRVGDQAACSGVLRWPAISTPSDG